MNNLENKRDQMKSDKAMIMFRLTYIGLVVTLGVLMHIFFSNN